MKNLIAITLLLITAQISTAQVKVGFRGGMSTTNIDPSELIITNSNEVDAFKITMEEARYGVHIGGYIQATINKFFIQPEILFNSNKIDFSVDNIFGDQPIRRLATESYQYLDIPVMMGFKLGALRLQAGPVAHMYMDSSSDLSDLPGYVADFEKWTYGYQTGIGLDIWKFALDVKYEGNFTSNNDHFEFFGKEYSFSDNPTRFIASLGISF